MSRIKRFIFLGSIYLLTPLAHSLDFTEFGLLNFSAPTREKYPELSLSPPVGIAWGVGFGLGFQLEGPLFFEVSLLYTHRKASQDRISLVQLPILVRYWVSEHFSFGIGPYLAHAVGNIASKNDSVGFDQVGWNRDELGIALSARYKTPINSFLSFVIDARFNVVISKIYEWQSWAGLSLLI